MQNPTLANQAVAVHAAVARRGRRILACSAPAERRGVQVDMPLAEASSLRRRGAAALHLLAHDEESDLEQLAQLAEHCERFSPLVGWRTTDDQPMAPASGPDCLLLDVTNIGRHFGDEVTLVNRACESLRRRSLSVSAGLAGTVGAAWAAAHFDSNGRLSNPPHQCLIAPGQEEAALGDRPPDALRLAPTSLTLMRQLGITRGHQLAALPRAAVSSRLGFAPLKRWDQALGATAESILAYRAPAEFAAEQRFDAPVSDRRALEHTVGHLVEELTRQLRAARRGAVLLACRLDSLQGQTTQLTIGLFEPTDDADHLKDLLQLQLETAPLEKGVERMTLTAPQVASIPSHQRDLFGQHETTRGAAQLVDRLRQRLGERQIFQAQLRADAQPERAYTCVTKKITQAKPRRAPAKPTSNSDAKTVSPPLPLHRPLSLSQPTPLSIFSWLNEMPKQFSWNEQLVEVFRFWGPERIETGWWRGRSVRRDYYRVELRGGERLWIFRQMNTNQWFLHGWYC